MPEIVVETVSLRRTFAGLVAVDNLDLKVEKQQFYGFLGPNGAGKSTTIKMLTGLLRPTSGQVRILGLDLAQNSVAVKGRIGVVPEGLALFERLTGAQLLNFVGRMYGLDREIAAERSAELLEFMDLKDSADKLVADYSHGMKKKTALAAAVIHGPAVLFLDEPFEGVDAIAATTLKRLLQRFITHGGTVFLTSHVLEVVERLCTHIGIIRQGRMVASGSLEELRAGVRVEGHLQPSLTLEEIFLQVVGGSKQDPEVLSWL
ncbi:MAG TPA: ABC transporter ATP-binding protein [Verrucomicrobiae bacterium]|jgi:ABC-2 type transport system ATP-binding protein|nr:ABC transporter ATP-binding protein [Verrucomicrobiae bacterium]